jgi:hypothetical protein
MDRTYSGNCFCGTVSFTATGSPAAMGYCHCASCRHWSAGPINAFTLWQPDALKVASGGDSIGTYNKTPNSSRKWCTVCGGHLFTEHPGMKLVDIYASNLPELDFQPAIHVNYAESVLPMKDGLPKFRDFPKEVGGSGETVPE